MLLVSSRFWPGEYIALNEAPPQLGDSYQMACDARTPNSTRLSPPVLPMMTR